MSSSNEALILSHITESGDKGCNINDLVPKIPGLSLEEIIKIVNKLITKKVVCIFTRSDGVPIFKVQKVSETPAALKECNLFEKVVYEFIEKAGNGGLLLYEIKSGTKLIPTVLRKTLKALIDKHVVKMVKSCTNKNVYMLYEFEPNQSVTGGTWFSNQQIDSEFIEILSDRCYLYLLNLRQKCDNNQDRLTVNPLEYERLISACTSDVIKSILDSGISKVELKENEIAEILDALVYDGKIEKKTMGNGNKIYKSAILPFESVGLSSVECLYCPKNLECFSNKSAKINPYSCPILPKNHELIDEPMTY